MFVHRESPPILLAPNEYWDSSLFTKEQERLRDRVWHWVCLKREVSQNEELCSRTVAGVPVVVWNVNGKLRAFKNVCPHRHAKILPDGCGKADLLVCQYHGWQFGTDGKVNKIPDETQSRNISLQTPCLDEYLVEVVGDFVVLSFDVSARPLSESIGKVAQEIELYFGDRKHFYYRIKELKVNWKIIIENLIETTHIPIVHGLNSKNYIINKIATEDLCDHSLESSYTRYVDMRLWDHTFVGFIYRFLAWLLCGKTHPKRFIVSHVFPNFIFYYADLFSACFFIEPLEAERSRIHLFLYSPKQKSWKVLLKPAQILMERVVRRAFFRVLDQDYVVLLEVQEGIRHAMSDGVLSRREERIHSFHSYLKQITEEKNSERR